MPKIRRRHNRYKEPNKGQKHWRKHNFTFRNIRDSKTGLIRSRKDTGRSGRYGPLDNIIVSKKSAKVQLRTRCNKDCPICKGRTEPGCVPGRRHEEKMALYHDSVARIEEKLSNENKRGLSRLELYRNMIFFYFLQKFTFKSGNFTERFNFCLYFSTENFVLGDYYSIEYLRFQNTLSSRPYLIYRREPNSLVLSARTLRKFLCISGMSLVCARIFLRNEGKTIRWLLPLFCKKLFFRKSIRRIIGAEWLRLFEHVEQSETPSDRKQLFLRY